jgi:oligoribonuclease
MSQENVNLCWLDLETTGLDAKEDAILEIAVVITTPQLEEIAHYTAAVAPSVPTKRIGAIHPKVAAMHSRSGLWAESLGASLSFGAAAEEVRVLLVRHNALRSPLCGSSVHFDRKFLAAQHPRLHDDFGYRNIDVSSWLEMSKRIAPDIYNCRPGRDAEPAHRALDDIRASIASMRYYMYEARWLAQHVLEPSDRIPVDDGIELSDGVPTVTDGETEHPPVYYTSGTRPSQDDREGVTRSPWSSK